jgi:hypothetical protein
VYEFGCSSATICDDPRPIANALIASSRLAEILGGMMLLLQLQR